MAKELDDMLSEAAAAIRDLEKQRVPATHVVLPREWIYDLMAHSTELQWSPTSRMIMGREVLFGAVKEPVAGSSKL